MKCLWARVLVLGCLVSVGGNSFVFVRGAAAQTVQTTSTLLEPTTIGSGARAMGMGGAFVAVADDATAASWNPAGLSTLSRPEVSFVMDVSRVKNSIPAYTTASSSVVASTGSTFTFVTSNDAYSYLMKSSSPDFLSVTYPFAAGRWKIVPQFSYRRTLKNDFAYSYTRANSLQPFNNGRPLGPSNMSTSTEFEGSGGLDVYAATVGVSFDPRWHVGVAFNVWRADAKSNRADMTRNASTLSTDLTVTDTHDVRSAKSVDVGVLFKPLRQLSVGAVVRNGFNLSRIIDLTRTYAYEPTFPNALDHDAFLQDATIEWPRSIALGGALMPSDSLVIAVDYTWTNWSRATLVGTSTTTITYTPPRPGTTIDAVVNAFYPYNAPAYATPQQDARQIRAGAEFLTIRSSSGGAFIGIPVRGGFYRDKSLQPQLDGSPLVSTGFTGGAGALWRQLSVDVAVVRQSVEGLLQASTSFASGVTSLVSTHVGKAVFTRVLMSSTVRF